MKKLLFAIVLAASCTMAAVVAPTYLSPMIVSEALAQAATAARPATGAQATLISLGSYAGEVLLWLAAAFSVPVGALLTAWLIRLFRAAGLEVTHQMSEQLNKVLVNGLNDAAQNGAKLANSKINVHVSDPIVASAIQYTLERMPDTVKALGMNPEDGETVKVLRSRIATLVADPKEPTPAINGNGTLKAKFDAQTGARL